MMPTRGLDPKELILPKKVLPARGGIYFSAIALSMWDNIHGPKVLQIWQGPASTTKAEEDQKNEDEASSEVLAEKTDLATAEILVDTLTPSAELSDSTLLLVVNYTLNDEAARAEDINGIESKFYSLSKFKLIAYTSIFTVELVKGKREVFSFLLLLPISESSEFLARYIFCELTLQKLIQDSIITPLKESQKDKRDISRGSVKVKIDEVLKEFDKPLLRFVQTMLSLKQNPLPEKINLADTFLGKDSSRVDIRTFLTSAITSHIQTSGYTIVLGSNTAAINKMILTLGMFLSAKERKMSQLVCEREGREEQPHYQPHLFLQGLVWTPKRRDSPPGLPFTKADLYLNRLPHTIIYLDDRQVFLVEPKINHFIGKKEEALNIDPERRPPVKSGDAVPHFKNFKELERDMMSSVVKDFLNNLWMLNTVGGLRETFIAQFIRLLKLKALALAKYLDTEVKRAQSNLDVAADILTLKSANASTTEKHRPLNLAALQNDLAIDCPGDLYVVLAFTEKIRPRTYFDVLGDPQLDALAVVEEFASL